MLWERICGPLSLIAISTGTPSAPGPSRSPAVVSPARSRASSRASIRSASPSSVRAAVNATSIWVLVSSADTTVDSQRRDTTSITATATRFARAKWV